MPGIRVFIWSLQSKVCVSRSGGPERAPPGASEDAFFRVFSIQDENKVMFFSEFVWGSLFETFFRLFLKIWRPSNSEGHPFKAKTYGHLEISSFFQFGALFRKNAFFEFQDPKKEHPEAPRRHSSTSPSIQILKLCVFLHKTLFTPQIQFSKHRPLGRCFL